MLVSGRLDQRSWEDKNSGQKRSRVEIVVEDFNFTSPNTNSEGASRNGYSGSNNGSTSPKNDDMAQSEPEDEEPIDLSEIPF